MAHGFRRTRHGVRARLDDSERRLLAHLLVEVHDMLDDESAAPDSDPLAALVGIGTAVDTPSDPAVARLLPDAYRDDPDAAGEFRRYTEVGLRQRKREGLERARRTLGREGTILLDDDEAQAWVVALTDVRLVLAARMGLESDDDHDRLYELAEMEAASAEARATADPDAGTGATEGAEAGSGTGAMMMVYDFLTWLQETLVQALLEPLPDS